MGRMLRRDPEDRYQTISEVIVDLERAKLAAAVPSYATLEFALRDPVMRQRLVAPIEATQPDLRVKETLEAKPKKTNAWLVRYRDSRGTVCKSKATAAQIMARLQAGTIPLDADACQAGGKFQPLARLPEFATLVATLQATRAARRKAKSSTAQPPLSRWLLAGALLGGAVLTILVVTAYLLLTS